MDLNQPWSEATFIIFDTETTGKYPLEAQLCELAAVKWSQGKIVDQYQTLIKPTLVMSEEVIAIHNITNEMVTSAPLIGEKIGEFHRFIGEGIPVAHHVPFDLGFLAPEFEKARLPLPVGPVLCSSLLSRAVIPESPNHRMATLVSFLGLEGGQAHRALDDTIACLGLWQKILERMGPKANIAEIIQKQTVDLRWKDYSIQNLRANRVYAELISGIEEKRLVEIVYTGGSRPGKPRTVQPIGLVRNHQGDFLVAREESEGTNRILDENPKRYFLERITAARS